MDPSLSPLRVRQPTSPSRSSTMDDNESFLELDISAFPSAMNPFASSTHLHQAKASQAALASAVSNGSISSLSVNSVHDSALSDEGLGDFSLAAPSDTFAAPSHPPPAPTEPPPETPKRMSDIMADLDSFMSSMANRPRRPLPSMDSLNLVRPTPSSRALVAPAPQPAPVPSTSSAKTPRSNTGLLGFLKKDPQPTSPIARTASLTLAGPHRAAHSFPAAHPSSSAYIAARRGALAKPETLKHTPPPGPQAPAFKPRTQPSATAPSPVPAAPQTRPPGPPVPSFRPPSASALSSVPAFKPPSAAAANLPAKSSPLAPPPAPSNILSRAATIAAADLAAASADRGYLSDTDADGPSSRSFSTDPSQRRARTTRRVRVKRSTKLQEDDDPRRPGGLYPEPEAEPEPEPAPMPAGSILALFQQHKLKFGHISPEEQAAADAAAAAAARRNASPDPTARRRGQRPGSRSLQEHEMRSLTLGFPPHWREAQSPRSAAVLPDGGRRLAPTGKGDSPRDFEAVLLHPGKSKGAASKAPVSVEISPDAPLAATMMEHGDDRYPPRYATREPHDMSPVRGSANDPMSAYQNNWRRYRDMSNVFYRVEPARRSGVTTPQPVFYAPGGSSPEQPPQPSRDRRGRSVSKGRHALASPLRRHGPHMAPVDSAASLLELRGRGGGSRSSTSGDEVSSGGKTHHHYSSRSHSGNVVPYR